MNSFSQGTAAAKFGHESKLWHSQYATWFSFPWITFSNEVRHLPKIPTMLVSPENTRSLPGMFLEIDSIVVQVPDDFQYSKQRICSVCVYIYNTVHVYYIHWLNFTYIDLWKYIVKTAIYGSCERDTMCFPCWPTQLAAG